MMGGMARPPAPAPDLHATVEALCCAAGGRPERRAFPSRDAVVNLLEALRGVLFPGFFGPSELSGETLRYHLGATLDQVLHDLAEQIRRAYRVTAPGEEACEARALAVARAFVARLPEVRRLLGTDVQAAFEGDPALRSPDEAILCYPGILAITCQRLAHELHRLEVPLIPRVMTEHAHALTGIDIHPGARIGEAFFIDHGTGVVIGETCILGRGVRLYQGVTLGAKRFPLDAEGKPIKGIARHPILEDGVTVYANATLLGRITVGWGSTIGGNVWLTRSVPAGSTVTQATEQDGLP